MDTTEVLVIVGLVTLVITDVIKENLPGIKGNLTRLIAALIGGALGWAVVSGLIPAQYIALLGGVVAVAGNTLARGGSPSTQEVK